MAWIIRLSRYLHLHVCALRLSNFDFADFFYFHFSIHSHLSNLLHIFFQASGLSSLSDFLLT